MSYNLLSSLTSSSFLPPISQEVVLICGHYFFWGPSVLTALCVFSASCVWSGLGLNVMVIEQI